MFEEVQEFLSECQSRENLLKKSDIDDIAVKPSIFCNSLYLHGRILFFTLNPKCLHNIMSDMIGQHV